jgi:hypothetical protein
MCAVTPFKLCGGGDLPTQQDKKATVKVLELSWKKEKRYHW